MVYWLSIDWIHRRKEKKKWRNCSKSINYGHHLREFIDFCLFLIFHVRFVGQDSNKNEVVDDSRRYVFGGLWISLSCMSDNFSCMENNNYVELRSNLWWFFNNFIFLLRTFLIIITSWWYLNIISCFLCFLNFMLHENAFSCSCHYLMYLVMLFYRNKISIWLYFSDSFFAFLWDKLLLLRKIEIKIISYHSSIWWVVSFLLHNAFERGKFFFVHFVRKFLITLVARKFSFSQATPINEYTSSEFIFWGRI